MLDKILLNFELKIGGIRKLFCKDCSIFNDYDDKTKRNSITFPESHGNLLRLLMTLEEESCLRPRSELFYDRDLR